MLPDRGRHRVTVLPCYRVTVLLCGWRMEDGGALVHEVYRGSERRIQIIHEENVNNGNA